MRKMRILFLCVMMSVALFGCASGPREGAPSEPSGNGTPGDFKAVALQMTTANENSTTAFQYNFAAYLGDGRGITFGIVGFTTGTYDGNDLIRHYTALNPGNPLARYIPALDAVDSLPHDGNEGDSNDSVEGLDGFIEAVRANNDPLFRQAQMDKMEELYWKPAMGVFEALGARYPLTQAFLYDMVVNHGETGARRMVEQASEEMGGTPGEGADEVEYLKMLMDIRHSHLVATANPGADRVNAYRRVLKEGNMDLVTPFPYSVYGDDFTIDGNVY